MIQLRNRLGATITLPATISWRRVPFAIRVPVVDNAHGDGSIVIGRHRLEARQFRLSGSIYYPSRERIRQEADTILSFLQHRPIEVFKWPGSERRLYAYPQGMSQDWLDVGAELVVDIPMLAPDPYWYGQAVTLTQAAAGDWQLDVDGNASTHPVVGVTLQASGSGLTIANLSTGHVIDVSGSYQSGDVVTIDTARYHAEVDGEPIIDRLNDQFIGQGFALQPGINELQYTGPAATVTLTYRPRWY